MRSIPTPQHIDVTTNYQPHTKYVMFNPHTRMPEIFELDQLPPELKNNTQYQHISNNKKLILKLEESFFHCLVDAIPIITQTHKLYPNTEFIIYIPKTGLITRPEQIIDFIKKVFTKQQINHTFIEYGDPHEALPILKINHFYYKEWHSDPTFYTVKEISNFLRAELTNPNVKPHRKIYLSRSKVRNKPFPKDADLTNIEFKNDTQRVDNELKLENYFKAHGLEIIYPEDFETFQEQLDTMNETKLLVSLTSAGLVNAIMMQPGQTQIELQVELVTTGPEGKLQQNLHMHYQEIAFAKKLISIALPNKRNANEIINYFENNAYLRKALDD
jgi:capsular polysaccharide biosynthesis protein